MISPQGSEVRFSSVALAKVVSPENAELRRALTDQVVKRIWLGGSKHFEDIYENKLFATLGATTLSQASEQLWREEIGERG
jgi:hypothetical protein